MNDTIEKAQEDPQAFMRFFWASPTGKSVLAESEQERERQRKAAAAEIQRLNAEEAAELPKLVKLRDSASAKFWKARDSFRQARSDAAHAAGRVVAAQGRFAVLRSEQEAIVRRLVDKVAVDDFIQELREEHSKLHLAFGSRLGDEKGYTQGMKDYAYPVISNWDSIQAKARRYASGIQQAVALMQGSVTVDDLPAEMQRIRAYIADADLLELEPR